MTSAVEVTPDVPPSATMSRNALPRGSARELRNAFAFAAITLLILLVAFWPAFEQPGGLMDEGMILVYPELIQHGQVPYRDFETFYGPAGPAVLAPVFAAFGADIFVERTLGLLYRVAILLGIFTIVQPRGNSLAAGCMLLAGCLLLGTGLPAYAWIGAIACAIWSLWFASQSQSAVRCFLAGLLAGSALLFRIDTGPAILLSALPLLSRMTLAKRGIYLMGGALALLPLGTLILLVGWKPVLNNLFLMPVIACNPARRLPLLSAQPYLLNLFFAHLAAVMINITAGWIALRSSDRRMGKGLLLAISLFALGLTHQATQRLDSLHFIFTIFLSLAIVPLSLVVIWSHFRNRRPGPTENWLAVVLTIAVLQGIAPELTSMVRSAFAAGFGTTASASFAELGDRSFPFYSAEMAASVDQMLKALDSQSKRGQRLFVGPADLRRTNYNDTWIYHMLPKLTAASYFLEMNPFSANRPGSRLAADIATADWLVLNRAWDTWNEPNRSIEYGSDAPNRVVRERFELRGKFGGYLLFHRKG